MRNAVQMIGLAVVLGSGAGVALSQDPYDKADETWISISGTVVDPKKEKFMLDYGEKLITVEVDDWDLYPEAYPLRDGDRVTVYGRVDNDLFDSARIEAGAIHIEGLNAYIYASSRDEEGVHDGFYPYNWTSWGVPVTNDVTIRGMVTSVDKDDREFRVNRGERELTVRTAGMDYNPLDEFGFQRVAEGDIVSVTGNIDFEFFGSRVLDADVITTLMDASLSDNESG